MDTKASLVARLVESRISALADPAGDAATRAACGGLCDVFGPNFPPCSRPSDPDPSIRAEG